MNDKLIDMKNKNIIITGANSGIGKETAIALAKMGSIIIMFCRNKERGEKAREEIKQKANKSKVELIIADLSDPNSIYVAVSRYRELYDTLDVLINNAGLFLKEKTIEDTGYETTFAVNHLGHYLLTLLLVDLLVKSAPSRIINVSSEAHRFTKLNLKDINMEKKYRSFRAYSNSKLANIMFTYDLSRRLEGSGVTVNALHPGFVNTNFGKNQYNKLTNPFIKLSGLFTINSAKGAKTSIYLASSPEVKDITGKYFRKSKVVRSSRESQKLKLQEELRELSQEYVKNTQLVPPELNVF
jgi:NAD(P)-dependent dehydrogenase (short-subunit alcohol dehydrogenase family)